MKFDVDGNADVAMTKTKSMSTAKRKKFANRKQRKVNANSRMWKFECKKKKNKKNENNDNKTVNEGDFRMYATLTIPFRLGMPSNGLTFRPTNRREIEKQN